MRNSMKKPSLVATWLSATSLLTATYASDFSSSSGIQPHSNQDLTEKALAQFNSPSQERIIDDEVATQTAAIPDSTAYRLTVDILREHNATTGGAETPAIDDEVATQAQLFTGNFSALDPELLRQRAEAANMSPEALARAISIVREVRKGIVPEEVVTAFHTEGRPELDLSSEQTIPQQMERLLSWTKNLWTPEVEYYVNIFLRAVVTPEDNTYPADPIAKKLFGSMNEGLTQLTFSAQLQRIFNEWVTTPLHEGTLPIASVNRPYDWAALQFVAFFFKPAISLWSFNLNTAGLGEDNGWANIGQVTEVIDILAEAKHINILGLDAFQPIEQKMLLKYISEIRQKNISMLVAPIESAALKTWLQSLFNPEFQSDAYDNPRVEVMTVINFTHPTLQTSLPELLETLNDDHLPQVWEHTLSLRNFEQLARGDVLPIVEATLSSPFGKNLKLDTLEANRVVRIQKSSLATLSIEHQFVEEQRTEDTAVIQFADPTTMKVLTTLVNAHAKPNSQLEVLDLEGSTLPNLGWDELSKLSPIKKIRFSRMKIPHLKTQLLSGLKLYGANMVACDMSETDTLTLVSGWLANPNFLGVDLRGNQLNEALVSLAIESGFKIYGTFPYGIIIAKNMR